eukprot:3394119-Pyramimonas_sp.AAC.1
MADAADKAVPWWPSTYTPRLLPCSSTLDAPPCWRCSSPPAWPHAALPPALAQPCVDGPLQDRWLLMLR